MDENIGHDQTYESDDKTIYGVITDRYQVELQRTRDIESKATGMIGFIGLLLGFSANLGFNHLTDIINNSYLLIFYIVCIFLLIFTFILAALSLYYGNGELWVLDTDYFMEAYVYNNKSNSPILPTLSVAFNEGIRVNNGLNIEKNNFLKKSIKFFIVSSTCVLLFSFYYAYTQQPVGLVSNLNISDNSSAIDKLQNNFLENNSTSTAIRNYSEKSNLSENKLIINNPLNNSPLSSLFAYDRNLTLQSNL